MQAYVMLGSLMIQDLIIMTSLPFLYFHASLCNSWVFDLIKFEFGQSCIQTLTFVQKQLKTFLTGL